MNNIFAKSALAAGLVAAGMYSQTTYAASATAVAGDVVVISCSAPSAGTAGGTVYTVDAISSTSSVISTKTISLPSTVAAGSSCAAAVNSLTATYAAGSTSVAFYGVNPANGSATSSVVSTQEPFIVPGTSYGVTQNAFVARTASTIANFPIYIGCAAGTPTAGSTVYSVDTGALSSTSEVEHILNIRSLVGLPCSQALGTLQSSATGSASGTYTNAAVTIGGVAEVVIPNAGYGLNLYTIQ